MAGPPHSRVRGSPATCRLLPPHEMTRGKAKTERLTPPKTMRSFAARAARADVRRGRAPNPAPARESPPPTGWWPRLACPRRNPAPARESLGVRPRRSGVIGAWTGGSTRFDPSCTLVSARRSLSPSRETAPASPRQGQECRRRRGPPRALHAPPAIACGGDGAHRRETARPTGEATRRSPTWYSHLYRDRRSRWGR